MRRRRRSALAIVLTVVAISIAGCDWQGINSLPLPGVEGRGSGSQTFHVSIANVGTLQQNAPVMMNDAVIGSVGPMRLDGWRASVDIDVKAGVVVPANVSANIGQTSLLGSSHLQLLVPPGVAPRGSLADGTSITRSGTYPSTEQTLSSLSVVINGGGTGQLSDIAEEFDSAIGGRQDSLRQLLSRLHELVDTLDDQRGEIVSTIDELNGFAGQLSANTALLDRTFEQLPKALQVLVDQRADITTALTKLGSFSSTMDTLLTRSRDDMLSDLQNLEPTVAAIEKVGDKVGRAVSQLGFFPFSEYVFNDGMQGDYMNLYITIDFTIPRLRRSMLQGTPLGDQMTSLPAVVGRAPTGVLPDNKDPLGKPGEAGTPDSEEGGR